MGYSEVSIDLAPKTKTARLLTPSIVLATLCVLIFSGGVGFAVAVLSFLDPVSVKLGGVCVAMGFITFSSSCSIVYLGMHLGASIDNKAVGLVRPPAMRLHAMCFTLGKIVLVGWIIGLTTSSVALAKSSFSHSRFMLQVTAIVASALGFLTMVIILTALESCSYPFQLPAFIDRRMVVCRVSDFGDDMDALERSVSKLSFADTEKELQKRPSHEIPRKPVPPPKPARQPVPGEWPERPITPLLPPIRARSRGWGEEWIPRDAGMKKGITRHDSAISLSMSEMKAGSSGMGSTSYMWSSSSIGRIDSGYTSFSDRESICKTMSLRRARARTVTPSRSIGNLSRRSPLSTVRSADFPELAVRPTLRYSPPPLVVTPPHEWRLSRTASMSKFVPFADIRELRRRSSSGSEVVRLRGPPQDLPPLPNPPFVRRRSLRQKSPRKNSVRRIPGAYVHSYHELELEVHVQKIEASIDHQKSQMARRKSQYES